MLAEERIPVHEIIGSWFWKGRMYVKTVDDKVFVVDTMTGVFQVQLTEYAKDGVI